MTANAFVPAFRHPPVYSPWFDLAAQAPWEPGVYEIEGPGIFKSVRFSYWDGKRFKWLSQNPDGAFRLRNDRGGGHKVTRWRGIVPPSRLPRFITETWGQACARVPSLSEFSDKPTSAIRVAEVLYLADCMPGYELMQFGGLPGLSFIFRRRDPA